MSNQVSPAKVPGGSLSQERGPGTVSPAPDLSTDALLVRAHVMAVAAVEALLRKDSDA